MSGSAKCKIFVVKNYYGEIHFFLPTQNQIFPVTVAQKKKAEVEPQQRWTRVGPSSGNFRKKKREPSVLSFKQFNYSGAQDLFVSKEDILRETVLEP